MGKVSQLFFNEKIMNNIIVLFLFSCQTSMDYPEKGFYILCFMRVPILKR